MVFGFNPIEYDTTPKKIVFKYQMSKQQAPIIFLLPIIIELICQPHHVWLLGGQTKGH
jgi:hypothetical protein